MFHTPAHKAANGPSQHRDPHPSRQTDEDSKQFPTAPREQHPRAMTDYLATGIAEGFEEAESQDEVRAAWQHLVNTGLAWRLQGWFGRTAQSLIDAGEIDPPTTH